MEKKVKHRIIGIVVILSLGIILFPFFQADSNDSTDITLTQAPPFPEQAFHSPPVSEDPTPATSSDVADNSDQQPDDIIRSLKPSVISAPLPMVKTPSTTPDVKMQTKALLVGNPLADNKPKQNRATFKKGKQRAYANHNLVDLKSAAWVIQIGSFKNKENALHLVNRLRAKGYPAFIQQTSSQLGTSTRVFVGPENKRANARALASQLESELHISGIVISYKPLAL